jgi:hypothetical protein
MLERHVSHVGIRRQHKPGGWADNFRALIGIAVRQLIPEAASEIEKTNRLKIKRKLIITKFLAILAARVGVLD